MKRFGRLLVAALLTVGAWCVPAPAWAQRIPLSELLPRLLLAEIVLESPPTVGVPGNPDGFTHLAHFSPIEANEPDNPVVAIVQAFNSQMATQFATFPLGSSSGGLTYEFDETLGTFRRGSRSFGPLFGERALTIGRHRWDAGMNVQFTSYRGFEGRRLDDESIAFYLRHEDCCTVVLLPVPPGFDLTLEANGTRLNPPLEGDLIEARLSLDASARTTAFFANYGMTDSWDVGVAVPFVHVTLDATVRARILRLVTAVAPRTHTFSRENPDAEQIVHRSGHAAGIGDVVVRTKYRVLRTAGGGLAVGVDLRLPTGDENELLGAGGVQSKVQLIASTEHGRFGEHVNAGYTWTSGHAVGTVFSGLPSQEIPNEVNYAGGITFAATPRMTLVADIVGRTLRNLGRLEAVSKPFEYTNPVPGPGCDIFAFTCATASFEEFQPRAGSLSLVLGAAGVKFNPVGNLLVTAHAALPLSKGGLRSRITTIIGVDYAF